MNLRVLLVQTGCYQEYVKSMYICNHTNVNTHVCIMCFKHLHTCTYVYICMVHMDAHVILNNELYPHTYMNFLYTMQTKIFKDFRDFNDFIFLFIL